MPVAIPGATIRESAGPVRAPLKGRIPLLESWFPPGMKMRAHFRHGPEVFHVLEGEPCVETREGIALVTAGEPCILEGGRYLQASPKGRQSLVLLVIPDDTPWMSLASDGHPKQRCSDAQAGYPRASAGERGTSPVRSPTQSCMSNVCSQP